MKATVTRLAKKLMAQRYLLFLIASFSTLIATKFFYSDQSLTWDEKSIKCLQATASEQKEWDQQSHTLTMIGFGMRFVLLNSTNKDYTLPANVRLVERDTDSQALRQFNGKIERSFIIPANDRAVVEISLPDSCGWWDLDTNQFHEIDEKTCFNNAMKNITEFIGYDDAQHKKLIFIKPTLQAN